MHRQLALELVQEELLGGQGERRGGRPLEEARERQADARLLLQAMADTREEERAAAQGVEVVLPPDARDAQDVAPDVRHRLLGRRRRRLEAAGRGRLELGDRKNPAVELAARVPRQGGKQGEERRHHRLGEALFQEPAELGRRGALPRPRRPPGDQRAAAGAPPPGRAAPQATSARSPARRSSIPTAASATAGCCASTPSISASSMRSPRNLTWRSMRPRYSSAPSSPPSRRWRARSPVVYIRAPERPAKGSGRKVRAVRS